jgi:hypothetical protein
MAHWLKDTLDGSAILSGNTQIGMNESNFLIILAPTDCHVNEDNHKNADLKTITQQSLFKLGWDLMLVMEAIRHRSRVTLSLDRALSD